MKHGTLLYDTYRAAAHDRERVASAMDATPYAAMHQEMRQDGGGDMAAIWDAARVYVLTLEAMQVIADATERLHVQHLPTPRPPALPLWVEFDEQRVLRIEGMPYQFSGILLYADGERVTVILMGAGAPIGLTYSPHTQAWDSALLEVSPLVPPDIRCQFTTCPIHVREQRRSPPGISSRDVLLAEDGLACACFGVRHDILRFLTAFLAFLTADGVTSEEIVVQPAAQPRKTRQRHHGATRVPQNPIRYQRLSLTHPSAIAVRRLPSGQIDVQHTADDDASTLSREITKRAHPRLLIAGPGQRWTKTQIVFVHASRPFQRRVSGHSTRFIVEE